MILFLLLLVKILVESAPSVSSQHQQLPQNVNIFILAGQSNMAGRGGVTNDTISGKPTWDGVVPVQSHPNPSILRLAADLTWVLAHEPLHGDIDYNKINGVGPGMAFANAILTQVPNFGVVGLVPCAIGGTSITQWGKGGFLYDQLVRRTQFALRTTGARFRGLLWYQGESDTETREDAVAYEHRLRHFFSNLRYDLHFPSLPIFQVGLASGAGPFLEMVREAQIGIGRAMPNVEFVDAKGLPLEPDSLHLTTPAQVHLGQLLANAFLQSHPNYPIRLTSSNSQTISSIAVVYNSMAYAFLVLSIHLSL